MVGMSLHRVPESGGRDRQSEHLLFADLAHSRGGRQKFRITFRAIREVRAVQVFVSNGENEQWWVRIHHCIVAVSCPRAWTSICLNCSIDSGPRSASLNPKAKDNICLYLGKPLIGGSEIVGARTHIDFVSGESRWRKEIFCLG